jgi:hypothetical protein
MKNAKGLKPLKPKKGLKPLKQAHSSDSKVGMGDSYGTGIKQKVGKAKEIMGQSPMMPKKFGVPPKKMA